MLPLNRFDYLQITDSSSNIIGEYCGNQTGKSVRVVGTVAVLIFHTDGSVQSSGFELSFSFFSISAGELISAVSTAFAALMNSCALVYPEIIAAGFFSRAYGRERVYTVYRFMSRIIPRLCYFRSR